MSASNSTSGTVTESGEKQFETERPDVSDPVIIIGGGLVGLSLAHALMKWGIPAVVYERDAMPNSAERGGWAVTIHWALEALRKCLPDFHFQYLSKIQVDVEQASKDTGKFMFLNLENLVPKYQIPPSKRMRINRAMFRHVLSMGVDIKWQKRLVSLDAPENGKVTVHFSDGTSASSLLVVGCDGAKSKMRELLFSHDPPAAKLNPLPVRALGVTIRLTTEEIYPLLAIDPLLFQGCHPDTGVFLWYSTVSTPTLNNSQDTDSPYFEGQLMLSWLQKSKSDSIPDNNKARLQKMYDLSAGFESRLRTVIKNIPPTTLVTAIALADWPTKTWPNHNGRITLAGDAAHPMTMYRGEAYNHGVTDASLLAAQIWFFGVGQKTQQDAVDQYDEEVVSRTHDAVLLSRQACLDAHDLNALKSDSPLVSRRTRILAPSTEA